VEALQMSVEGKKCEFCGANAITGAFLGARHIFYCFSCNVELSKELMTKMRAEHPEWLTRSFEPNSLEFYATDKNFQTWTTEAFETAVKTIGERHKKAG
jgi:hypothetical protein